MSSVQTRNIKPPKYLFYSIDGDIYISKLKEIKEVVNDLELGEVPLQNSSSLGMSSLRGEIISVLSLGKLIGTTMQSSVDISNSNLNQYILNNTSVTLIIEHKDLKYGLAIDSINQVGYLESTKFKESNEQPMISGHYCIDNRIATVINLASLLEYHCP